MNRSSADLVALAGRIAAEYQQVTEHYTVRLESAVPSLVGVWDAPRLVRVLGNLVSNAIKHGPVGSAIILRVAREEAAAGAWALVPVVDPGFGIPAAEIQHVFDWFYPASNVIGRVDGSGIGLAGRIGKES